MTDLFSNWIRRLPYVIQLLVFLLLTYATVVVFLPVELFVEYLYGRPPEPDIHATFFSAVVLAPVIETLVFQYLIFRIFYPLNTFKNRKWLVIFISAVLFGLSHFYDGMYIFWTFLIGIVLALAFYFYLPNYSKAFWSVVIIHALRNSVALLIDHFHLFQ